VFCGLLLALPASAADKAAPAPGKTPASHSVPMIRSGWAPETISGTIAMVDPAARLVVVQNADGVPFDLVITPRTRIESGDRALPLKDLSGYRNKSVSVRFVPERSGDVAESVRIAG
jgi:hypothetical protein